LSKSVTLSSFIVLFSCLSLRADSYTYQDIDAPGASSTSVRAINNAGSIIGTYSNATGTYGYLDQGGVFQTLSYAGQNLTPLSINDLGQFVATDSTASTYYLYSNGAYSVIPVPPDPYSAPIPVPPITSYRVIAINNSGSLLEEIQGPIVQVGGAILVTGDTSTIVALDRNFPTGLNNNDDIIGISYRIGNPGYYNGFLNGTTFNALDPGYFASTYPEGVNDSGQVVGYYQADSFYGLPPGAFMFQNGVLSLFDYPGAAYSELFGINNAGELVGTYTNADGSSESFLAIPQNTSAAPEPRAAFLLLAGGLSLFIFRRMILRGSLLL
jgi:probable HAF family extracellular repeat protein